MRAAAPGRARTDRRQDFFTQPKFLARAANQAGPRNDQRFKPERAQAMLYFALHTVIEHARASIGAQR